MRLKRQTKKVLSSILEGYGFTISESRLLYDWQKSPQILPRIKELGLQEGTKNYLRQNHPRLIELKERYARFNREVILPLLWTDDHIKSFDIRNFRGACYVCN